MSKQPISTPIKILLTLFFIIIVIVATLFIFNISTAENQSSQLTSTNQAYQASEAAKQAKAKQQALFAEAAALAKGYFYDEALAVLNSQPQLLDAANSQAFTQQIEAIQTAKAALQNYTGPIYHVFFHSLIADTTKAFDGDSRATGYDLYMTTVKEFKAILPQLLANDFVLIDLSKLAKPNLETGKMELAPILLPPDKKPLIISIDDVSYYDYMQKDGFASRLIVDDQGKVATIINTDQGEITTYDGDVMPILDSFVAENPQFAFQGAKGTIAVTGYQGVFGYRITDLQGEDLEIAKTTATKVANTLKNSGWSFASHSYTHNQYFKNYSITMDQLKYDTQRWQKYIEPILGPTHIFISPFGVTFKPNDPRYQYLVDQGFDTYCSVGSSLTTKNLGNSIFQSRIPLDGETLKNRSQFLGKYFFDVSQIIDSARP